MSSWQSLKVSLGPVLIVVHPGRKVNSRCEQNIFLLVGDKFKQSVSVRYLQKMLDLVQTCNEWNSAHSYCVMSCWIIFSRAVEGSGSLSMTACFRESYVECFWWKYPILKLRNGFELVSVICLALYEDSRGSTNQILMLKVFWVCE